ncbi:hypothetical protein [Pseudidiomarina aquimaris]|nr:hypothetical protein [Pseudidiomarina aquimaris]
MNFSIVKCIAVCALGLTLMGCSTSAPINDVQAATINHQLSHEQVRMAIIEAGAQRGWAMSDYSDDELHAELYVRQHYAKVRIPYSTEGFSIYYVASDNLDLSRDGKRIHRNYNRWVNNLRHDIQMNIQVKALQP